MFKIEKNIPIVAHRARMARRKYPFSEMEVGDSFLVEMDMSDKDAVTKKVNSILGSSRTKFFRKSFAKFSTRQTDIGIRVWRIK